MHKPGKEEIGVLNKLIRLPHEVLVHDDSCPIIPMSNHTKKKYSLVDGIEQNEGE